MTFEDITWRHLKLAALGIIAGIIALVFAGCAYFAPASGNALSGLPLRPRLPWFIPTANVYTYATWDAVGAMRTSTTLALKQGQSPVYTPDFAVSLVPNPMLDGPACFENCEPVILCLTSSPNITWVVGFLVRNDGTVAKFTLDPRAPQVRVASDGSYRAYNVLPWSGPQIAFDPRVYRCIAIYGIDCTKAQGPAVDENNPVIEPM